RLRTAIAYRWPGVPAIQHSPRYQYTGSLVPFVRSTTSICARLPDAGSGCGGICAEQEAERAVIASSASVRNDMVVLLVVGSTSMNGRRPVSGLTWLPSLRGRSEPGRPCA